MYYSDISFPLKIFLQILKQWTDRVNILPKVWKIKFSQWGTPVYDEKR
jgi:hypothetical protein